MAEGRAALCWMLLAAPDDLPDPQTARLDRRQVGPIGWHTSAMHSSRPARPGATRGLTITLALTVAVSLMAALPTGILAQDSTEAAESTASAEPSLTPAQAACQSVDDLTLIVGFLQSIDIDEDGWVPVVIGAIAGISEARALAGFVGEVYRPLVEDLIISLQAIRTTAAELSEMETTGSQIAAVGETITEIGIAMDALSTQLRASCPTG